MSWGEDLRIETPEQIDFNLEVAGPASRFYAQLLDWLVKWSVMAILAIATVGVAAAAGLASPAGSFLLLASGAATAFVFFLGYDIYFEGCRNGQTPGKKNAGLRVVRDDGGPVDVRAAAVRNVVGLADFLPAFYLGGGLIAAVNARCQRLGDMAAGTVVIRERTAEVSDDMELQILAVAANDVALGPTELANCIPEDMHVLLSFFARARSLDPAASDQLALKLCDTFLKRTGYRLNSPVLYPTLAYAFLAALYRDLKAWRRNA